MDATDLDLLRRAVALSVSAVEHGNHPFGALLAASDGTVVLEAENTVLVERDVTGHAETNLVRLASRRFGPDELAGYSLYSSCEPCVMCAGAIHWAGIGRVVYALSADALVRIAGDDLPPVRCRDVLGVTVDGPALEEVAAVPHRGFWPAR